jgi:hypothetical protein
MRLAVVGVMVMACVSAVWLLEADAPQQELRTLQPLDKGRVTYYIADGEPGSHYVASDRELATWALREWERTLDGAVKLETATEQDALLRVYWVGPSSGQYGEMRPLRVGGRRGAEVYIRPDTDALGPDIGGRARNDELFRETVVYLTCLHELGHAFGLSHTDSFADIMYFFGFGGDIPGFFGRYRDRLRSRSDISSVSGLSPDDVKRVKELYREPR